MRPLIKARRDSLKNQLHSIFTHRWETVQLIAVLCFVLVLMSCLSWGFMRTLGYLASVPTIGSLLIQKILEIAFLSTFSLIALSSMVTSLSTHFGSSDLEFLMSTPIPRIKIFIWKSIEAAIHASWMVALVLIPFLWVYSRIKHLDAGFLWLSFFLFFPFTLSASAIGVTLSTLFVSIFPRRRLMEFMSILGVLIFVLVYSGIRLTLPRKLMNPDQMEEVFEYVLYLQSPASPFLPSRWYVGALNAYAAGNWDRLALSCAMLFLFALAGLALIYFIGSKVLTGRKWSRVLEGSGGSETENPSSVIAKGPPQAADEAISKSLNPKSSLWKLLFLKELRFFFRDSERFSNASFILAVCAIYLVSIYRLPMDTPYLKNFLSFINLALGLFIIAALSLRFCFPQPSLELVYAWILRASPISARDFLGAKFIFNLVFLNFLGAILVILSPMFLGTDLKLIPIYLIAAFFCSNVLATMALGIGSAFPKKHFENVIQIETSFGGFLYAVCALAFVGLTLAVFAWPIRFYFQVTYLNRRMDHFDIGWLAALGIGYAALSAAISIFSWFWAKRSWEKIA